MLNLRIKMWKYGRNASVLASLQRPIIEIKLKLLNNESK
jgi:hypothetical protein